MHIFCVHVSRKKAQVTNSPCHFALKMQSSIQNRIFLVFFNIFPFRISIYLWKFKEKVTQRKTSSLLFLRHSYSRHLCNVTHVQCNCIKTVGYWLSYGFWRFELVAEKNVENSIQFMTLNSMSPVCGIKRCKSFRSFILKSKPNLFYWTTTSGNELKIAWRAFCASQWWVRVVVCTWRS